MPLSLAKQGETHTILKITGNEEIRLRLHNLGFVAGNKITVINELDGNLIVNVIETRIAISRSMAVHIMVS